MFDYETEWDWYNRIAQEEGILATTKIPRIEVALLEARSHGVSIIANGFYSWNLGTLVGTSALGSFYFATVQEDTPHIWRRLQKDLNVSASWLYRFQYGWEQGRNLIIQGKLRSLDEPVSKQAVALRKKFL